MSVSKERNGSWTVQMYVSEWTGVRRHIKKRGFKTKREALQWERSEKSKKQIDHVNFTISSQLTLLVGRTSSLKKAIKIHTFG